MPLLKRQPFVPMKPPPDLKADEEVFYLKLTNEIFKDYDEYFDRMILCNSLVWSCSLTGKANLTFQEAVDSEKAAKKVLKGFPRELKKALFYLVTLTKRFKVLDVCEDVFAYARERYFKNEVVLGVIGKLWCPSRVMRVIFPTKEEIEVYRKEQIESGEFEKNDYLKDDSWGPPPDLFRYEVQETDPDNPSLNEVHILEAIDVKREKTVLTRDKSRYLLKLASCYSEQTRTWRIRDDVNRSFGLDKCRFEDLFIGPPPVFDSTPGPVSRLNSSVSTPSSTQQSSQNSKKSTPSSKSKTPSNDGERKRKSAASEGKPKPGKKEKEAEPNKKQRSKSLEVTKKSKNSVSGPVDKKSRPNTEPAPAKKKPGPKPGSKREKPVEVKLTPQELRQIELERRAKQRENEKKERKLIADFKKLWFKPKEDLEVEDLKDLPPADPISFAVPNNLFGDFVAVLEFFNCYSNLLKVRDCFSSGVTFDILERALTKNEIAGPLSDIMQLLLRAIFRLQETEQVEIADINQDQQAAAELDVDEITGDVSASEAIEQATMAATWSTMYQNTPLHKLNLDHLSLTEVLRLHLLTSGARPSEKDVKWRFQHRGNFDSNDDPGLRLRLEEPQILKTLSHGSVFDLTMKEKLKLIMCLVNQILTFFDVRETMEDSFEQYRQNKATLKSAQVAEKRKDIEDNIYKHRLRTEKQVPDLNSVKPSVEKGKDKVKEEDKQPKPEPVVAPEPDKPQLTDEQIEALIQKRDKEATKRKEDYKWKECELLDAINKHERKLGVHPIGRDRAYRRYWIFNTLPGIFVEDDDDLVGSCLSTPTPYIADINLNDVNFIKENYEKLKQVEKDGSDKENSTLATPKKSPKKKQPSSKSRDVPLPKASVFGVCNGDTKTCPVHNTYTRSQKWYFFWSVEQLDALIEGLSQRGIREKELRQILIDEKEGLVNVLKRCPVTKLNTDNAYPEYLLSIAERKAQRTGQTSSKHLDPNLNYPEGTVVDNILELQLRDLILEMEEKVFLGTLGSLKVKDRLTWRKAIEDRGYDKQIDDLCWGKSKSLSKQSERKAGHDSKRRSSVDDDVASSTGSSLSESRPTTETFPTNPVIKDLACAILQFRQSIEPKFFKRPLGIGKDEGGKSKGKSVGVEQKAVDLINKGTSLSPLERWELSLMSSTSFSQLFMHLFTLDNSIEWSRSVLNARCRICRRKGDPDNMLLCDECNKGHHAYCLKPPLQVIPKGDWYCAECRPPEPPPKINRRARPTILTDDLLEDGLENSDEEDDYRDFKKSKQSGGRRSSPVRLDEDNEIDSEACEMCGFGGQVICCDQCPRLYHLQCLDPPKTRVPRGSWYCPECSNSSSTKRSKKGSKKKNKSRSKKKKVSKRGSSSSSEEDSDEEETAEDESDGLSDDDTNTEEDVVGYNDESGEENVVGEDDVENEEDGDSDEDEKPKMKVRFGGTSSTTSKPQRNSGYGTRSSGGGNASGSGRNRSSRNRKYVIDSDDDDEESQSEEEVVGRGKRKSASAAAIRIAQVAKRLRSDSKENDSSENSNDSNPQTSRHSRKRSYDSDSEGIGGVSRIPGEGPKRTRLQRMNTNQCSENGELDNVLLDRLLTDVMKHGDAWPFLKPVTKVEAPDYHEIVKHPMDLGTIKYKLNSMVYTCNEEFISDLSLVFSNCLLYNEASHAVSKAGKNLRTFTERRCSKLGIHFSDPSLSSSVDVNYN